MARPRSLIMPSETVLDDLRLLDREFCAIRPATKAERRTVRAKWRDVVYALVFRSCAGVDAIVTPTGSKGVPFTASLLQSLVIDWARKHGITRSAALYALAKTLFPNLDEMLTGLMPPGGRCRSCSCMWRVGGPLDPASSEHVTLAAMAADARERIAA
ncbi:hypothetical protein [Aureimonas leprariae]|uniref:Uncharacterized protein n=1 Tax=Plantimonas leprariae TaxID=2615207 RepID=A0A7V7PKY4_9HYPH|nr:hypothetical protein [Aureimonas leprariae]KAB0676713.1 hypothetical protein F6X38_20650 [Aureimonas leprariae]